MASNDYYNSFANNPQRYDPHQDTSYHSGRREDAPLPALPPSSSVNKPSSAAHANSPFNTPFDEDHSSYAYNSSSQHLNRPHSYDSRQNDPFTDSNAIHLQTKPTNAPYGDGGSSSPTAAMGHAEHYGAAAPLNPHDKEPKPKGVRGWFKGKVPWAVYTLSAIQITVFIVEIIKNAQLTGSPIEIHPQFNPIIGPSPYVLINMGARYVPCMRQYDVPNQPGVTVASIAMPCPDATTFEAKCTLSQLCGFGMDLKNVNGVQQQPNQWWRFITPIFLHGGLIHIGFNMLLQLLLGKDVERQIGTLRFLLVYFSAGIFGFVFGGNYSPNGILSTGCSGALFGIMAILLLDLLYTWKNRHNPVRELIFILLDIVICFVLGLLPGLDNFSHIGGFLTGIVLGICILHSPDALRERIGLDEPPYASMGQAQTTGAQNFLRRPVGFFKGRKPLWWAWWLLRAGALAAVFAGFIVLLNNFYVYRINCGWCKYLSCLPIKNWCEIGTLEFKTLPAKRALESALGLGISKA